MLRKHSRGNGSRVRGTMKAVPARLQGPIHPHLIAVPLAVATLDYTFNIIRHLSLEGADGPTPRSVVETASPGAKAS